MNEVESTMHICKGNWHKTKDLCAGSLRDKAGEVNKSQTTKGIESQPNNQQRPQTTGIKEPRTSS